MPGSGQGMWLQLLPFYPPQVWSGTDCLLGNRVIIDYLTTKLPRGQLIEKNRRKDPSEMQVTE